MNFCFYVGLDHGDIQYCRYGNDEDETPAKKSVPTYPEKQIPETRCLVDKDPNQ
jgi:hypothetical protein